MLSFKGIRRQGSVLCLPWGKSTTPGFRSTFALSEEWNPVRRMKATRPSEGRCYFYLHCIGCLLLTGSHEDREAGFPVCNCMGESGRAEKKSAAVHPGAGFAPAASILAMALCPLAITCIRESDGVKTLSSFP